MRLPSIQENNRNAVFLLGALAGLAGSIVTVFLVATAIWAAIRLAFRTLPYRIARSDLPFLLAATAYFAANMLVSVGRDVSAFASRDLLSVVIFVSVWLVIPRLRMSQDGKLFDTLILGAAFCGMLVLPLACWQAFGEQTRAEGGAGNPLPFALICCVFALLSLGNVIHETAWRRPLGWAGFVAGLIGLVASQSKGLLPAVFLCLLLFVVIFPGVLRSLLSGRGLIGLVAASIIVALAAIPFYPRLESAFAYFTAAGASAADGDTFSARETLWAHAGTLIAESPIIGHGVQNRRALIDGAGFDYTHFHNGFLTSLVDGGAIGFIALLALLLAPLATAIRAPRDDHYRLRLFVALALLATYVIGGMTNLIFWQDIYDSLFLWIAALVAVSVPVSPSNPLLFGRSGVL